IFLILSTIMLFVTIYYYINPHLLKDIYTLFIKEFFNERSMFILLSGFSNIFYLTLTLYMTMKIFKSNKYYNINIFTRIISIIISLLLLLIFYYTLAKLLQDLKDEYNFVENLKIILISLFDIIKYSLYIYI